MCLPESPHRVGLLPDGAIGIESGDFAIEFRGNKVVVLAKAAAEHYTLQLGHQSGVLDVHRTWLDPDGTPRHRTIFAIRHADIALLLNNSGQRRRRCTVFSGA